MKQAAILLGSGLALAAVLVGGFFLFSFLRYDVGNGNNAKMNQIEANVNAIHFSTPIEKKQCGGGGIDTSEWCTYTINAPLTKVTSDLTAAGYKVKDSRYSNTTYVGGNPETTIYISESEGMATQLEVKILEDGRTI